MGTLLFFWALGEFLHAVDILCNGRVTDLFKIGPELVTVFVSTMHVRVGTL